MSWSNVNVLWQKKNENNTAASHSLTLVPISVQQNIGELSKKWKVVFHAQQNPNRTLSRANRAGIKLKRNKLKKPGQISFDSTQTQSTKPNSWPSMIVHWIPKIDSQKKCSCLKTVWKFGTIKNHASAMLSMARFRRKKCNNFRQFNQKWAFNVCFGHFL